MEYVHPLCSNMQPVGNWSKKRVLSQSSGRGECKNVCKCPKKLG